MHQLKVTTGETATTTVLPEFLFSHLNLKVGDTLLVVPTPNGYLLTSNSEGVEEQLQLGLEFMNEYNETFKDLAQ